MISLYLPIVSFNIANSNDLVKNIRYKLPDIFFLQRIYDLCWFFLHTLENDDS